MTVAFTMFCKACGERFVCNPSVPMPAACHKCGGTVFVGNVSLVSEKPPGNCPLCDGTGHI